MYDFDHWNNCGQNAFVALGVGMAMYDFDHWNPCNLRNEMYPKLEWPCMISITETFPSSPPKEIPCWNGHVWFRSLKQNWSASDQPPSSVGMAMYDFDHWNRAYNIPCKGKNVGMAMYDFDHWNIIRSNHLTNCVVGMAMYDFDHWNLWTNFFAFGISVGMAMYDFDHWNHKYWCKLAGGVCWNGHVWFRSLKLC